MPSQYSILQEVTEGQVYTEPKYNFQSKKVKQLYNVLKSTEVAEYCKTPLELTNVIYPALQNVINDTKAYQDAKNNWDNFSCIVSHLENNYKIFGHLDDKVSMCFSLYMCLYH
jgi:hypothetical protein